MNKKLSVEEAKQLGNVAADSAHYLKHHHDGLTSIADLMKPGNNGKFKNLPIAVAAVSVGKSLPEELTLGPAVESNRGQEWLYESDDNEEEELTITDTILFPDERIPSEQPASEPPSAPHVESEEKGKELLYEQEEDDDDDDDEEEIAITGSSIIFPGESTSSDEPPPSEPACTTTTDPQTEQIAFWILFLLWGWFCLYPFVAFAIKTTLAFMDGNYAQAMLDLVFTVATFWSMRYWYYGPRK